MTEAKYIVESMLQSGWQEPSEKEKLALRRANKSSQRSRRFMSGRTVAIKAVSLAPVKWLADAGEQ
jgi:hypothetical protein